MKGSGFTRAAVGCIRKEVDVNEVVGQLPDEYMRDVNTARYDSLGKENRRGALHGAWVKVVEYDNHEAGNRESWNEKFSRPGPRDGAGTPGGQPWR